MKQVALSIQRGEIVFDCSGIEKRQRYRTRAIRKLRRNHSYEIWNDIMLVHSSGRNLWEE
jgi:hypothetical protein